MYAHPTCRCSIESTAIAVLTGAAYTVFEYAEYIFPLVLFFMRCGRCRMSMC